MNQSEIMMHFFTFDVFFSLSSAFPELCKHLTGESQQWCKQAWKIIALHALEPDTVRINVIRLKTHRICGGGSSSSFLLSEPLCSSPDNWVFLCTYCCKHLELLGFFLLLLNYHLQTVQ